MSGFPQKMSGRRPIDARRPSGGRSASGAHLCRPPFTATSAGPVGVAEGEDRAPPDELVDGQRLGSSLRQPEAQIEPRKPRRCHTPGRMRQFCERVLPVPAPHEQQALDLLG